MKKEGSDSAEPSLEGPVGQTTGNRPLNNQLPVNLTVAFQNAGRLVSNLWAEPCVCKFLFRLQRTPSTIQFCTKVPTLSGLEWVGVSQPKLCLKSPKSFLETVSTGSDSDLVNDGSRESLGNFTC